MMDNVDDKRNVPVPLVPDEDFNRTILWILKEIKKEAISTPDDEYVCIVYQTEEGLPHVEDQRRAINFLEKEKAIKISHKKYPSPFMASTADILNIRPTGFYIEVLQPKFEEVYASFAGTASAGAKEITFDRNTSILFFRGSAIEISKTKDSDPHYLLSILFRNKGKDWAYDEIWEDPYFRSKSPEYNPKTDWRKIYNAGYSVNEKVAKATTVKDFLSVSKTAVAVSKKYLG